MPKKYLTDPFLQNPKLPDDKGVFRLSLTEGKRAEFYDQHLIKDNKLKKKGVKGLFFRVTKARNIYFYYRYWFNDKPKSFKIGSYPNIGLSEARDKAREVAGRVNKGIDPQAEKNKRKHQPKESTFQELVNDYVQYHLPTLKESTRAEYKRIIDNELLPKLADLTANDITSTRLGRILSRKKKDGSPTMANRMRSVLSSIFSYGKTDPEIDLHKNPAEDTRRYKTGENTRDRYYNEDEIKSLWNAFENESEPFRSIFKMLLLTAQRKTETMRMKWDDINGNVWNIPAENAKNKQSHDVPLSDFALQVIEDMRPITGNSDYVFESPRLENEPIGWIKQAVERIRETSEIKDFRIHDLRRTAATYMAKGGVDPMIIGKVLNHKGLSKQNSITAVYNQHNYHPKKTQALNRWASKLENILTESEAKITKIG